MTHPKRSSFPLILNWVGGILSIGLIGLLVYWVVAVGPYDPNKVPVIEPMDGLARVAPETPDEVAQADRPLAVSAVAANAKLDPIEDITLAPEPLTIDQLATAEITDTSAPQQVVAKVAASAFPKPRPNAQSEPVQAVEVAVGSKLIQLGAYNSAALAEGQWQQLLDKHGDLLAGKQHLVVLAETSNGRFYRLRAAGFEDGAQSAAMCATLKAREVPCFPVTAK